MLDWFIIEEIKRRQEQEIKDERPYVELPIPEYDENDNNKKEETPEPKRVIIIDL